jgi:hypothetical protein
MDSAPARARDQSVTGKPRSPSPGKARQLPGNMRISFRRSPTPMKEVVNYRPSDPVQEVRSLRHQAARRPSQSPQRRPPALQGPPGHAQDGLAPDASQAAQPLTDNAHTYQSSRGKKGRAPFVPWKQWRASQKGGGKSKSPRRGKGKGRR